MAVPSAVFDPNEAKEYNIYLDGKRIRDAGGYDMSERCVFERMYECNGKPYILNGKPVYDATYGRVVMVVLK